MEEALATTPDHKLGEAAALLLQRQQIIEPLDIFGGAKVLGARVRAILLRDGYIAYEKLPLVMEVLARTIVAGDPLLLSYMLAQAVAFEAVGGVVFDAVAPPGTRLAVGLEETEEAPAISLEDALAELEAEANGPEDSVSEDSEDEGEALETEDAEDGGAEVAEEPKSGVGRVLGLPGVGA